jgi:uncharacterized protein (DUF2336 family)
MSLSIFKEVESALHDASGERRVEVLRRVTDLFVGQSDRYTPEQTELFDTVLHRLMKHIEEQAMVELSARVAPVANAPSETVRALARHDNIHISGPVLKQSPGLTDHDLIDIALTKSQAHMANIAGRNALNAKVTDVLVDHGDHEVAHRLAQNAGARLSDTGMAKLVMRSDGDDKLTESLARRADIPPHHFQNLLTQATEAVRAKLLQSAPAHQQKAIRNVLSQISAQIAPQPIAAARYIDAQRTMKAFSQDTELLKAKVYEFSVKKHVAEVIVGISLLSAMPVEQVDRLFSVNNAFGLLALCRSVMLDWESAWAIVMASASAGMLQSAAADSLHEEYNALSPASAQRLLRFWQTRQRVAQQPAGAIH